LEALVLLTLDDDNGVVEKGLLDCSRELSVFLVGNWIDGDFFAAFVSLILLLLVVVEVEVVIEEVC
jgi:hypothetical protein